MYQFYFLSIVMNLLAGITLAHEALEDRFSFGSFFNREVFDRNGFRLGVGIATGIVGIFKFLSVTAGNVPVIGDLLPAIVGIILGITLIIMYYKERSSVTGPAVEALDAIFVKRRSIIGILGIVTAILHFFFHTVLFL